MIMGQKVYVFLREKLSNPVHVRYIDACLMYEPNVRVLGEHQHQCKCTGFESFLEQQNLVNLNKKLNHLLKL